MRVLVCGGRNFTDKEYLFETLNALAKTIQIDCIIEGNASGADRLAGYWARKNYIDNIKFKAEWDKYGNAAGPIRNKQMLTEGKPDIVIAFYGGKGTANMVQQARSAGLKVFEV